jgi:hypothetical protein
MSDTGYCIAAFCMIFYSVPWAIAFAVQISDTNEVDCQGPAWFWSNLAVVYFIWTAVGCTTYLIMKFVQDRVSRNVAKLALSISFLPLLASAPMVVGLTIAYGRRAECPELEGILSTWFVISMIMLAVPYLVMSLTFYCGCTAYLADTFGPTLKLKKTTLQDPNSVELQIPLNPQEVTVMQTSPVEINVTK